MRSEACTMLEGQGALTTGNGRGMGKAIALRVSLATTAPVH